MERKISASMVNIAAHPHEGPATYLGLMRTLYGLDIAIRIHGDRYAWMTHLWENQEGRKQWLTGRIATFSKIDMDRPWLHMETRQAVEENTLDRIKRVVDGIQPNLHEFYFYVDLNSHLVVVEENDGERGLSPSLVERYFRNLVDHDAVTGEYGEVEVHAVQDRAGLNAIINSKYLRKIKIHLTRPNADSLADVERRLLEDLGALSAREMDLQYRAVEGTNLELSDNVKNIARVARKNGHVEGWEWGNHYSTKDHPLIKDIPYDDDVQTREAAFTLLARTMLVDEANNE